MTSLVVEPIASLESARSGWNELAVKSSNIFSTWEWGQYLVGADG